MKSKNSREFFNTIISNMFSNPEFSNYIFYAHLLSKCKIVTTSDENIIAGVRFMGSQYELIINTSRIEKEFNTQETMFLLAHEMLHIINNHVLREGSKNHEVWNISTDCAINQLINNNHIPESAITPESLKEHYKKDFPKLLSAEEYYNLLKDEIKKENQEGKGNKNDKNCTKNCSESSGSSGTSRGTRTLDNHEIWKESQGEPEVQKEITKQMLNQAVEETIKTRGSLPQNIEELLTLFNSSPQVNWKKVLKRITGNKKIGKLRTYMKKNRRFPNRSDLKGNKTNRTFTLVAIIDVSGSVSEKEILYGLNELHSICKQNNTKLKIVQVDTSVHGVEDFDKNTKIFNRKGSGGTYIEPAVKYIFENNIEHNAMIVLTDGYIENPTDWEKQPRCKVIWLCTTKNYKIQGVDELQNHSQYTLEIKE